MLDYVHTTYVQHNNICISIYPSDAPAVQAQEAELCTNTRSYIRTHVAVYVLVYVPVYKHSCGCMKEGWMLQDIGYDFNCNEESNRTI